MIELEKIKTYVVNLLEFKGVCKECEKEQPVWQLLYHLYVAVAIMEQLSKPDSELVMDMQKRLKVQFRNVYAKIKQKKRKEKAKKEKISPTTSLIKEKVEKEKGQETTPIILVASDFSSPEDYLKYRQELFHQECLNRKDIYGLEVVERFFDTWSEESPKRMKMRWEMEKTWNIDKRLKRFKKISYEKRDEAAQIGLENAKRMKAKEAATIEKQAVIAEIREDANARLEREIAERKQGAVSYEEYLQMKSTQKEPSLLCKN